jgi:hypothetical protein
MFSNAMLFDACVAPDGEGPKRFRSAHFYHRAGEAGRFPLRLGARLGQKKAALSRAAA